MTKVNICIGITVPGLLDVTRFLSLDVTGCDVQQLNANSKRNLNDIGIILVTKEQMKHNFAFSLKVKRSFCCAT